MMVFLTVELNGVAEAMLNKLVKLGYAKTKSEAIRQAVIHLGSAIRPIDKEAQEDKEWRDLAAKHALEDGDWVDADKLFKF